MVETTQTRRYIREKLSGFVSDGIESVSASIANTLEEGYKEAMSEITHVIADGCVGNDVYKGVVKVSFKFLEYVSKEIERAEKREA